MPMPEPPVSRRKLHSRCIDMHGYERDDGLLEVEATISDRKTYDFQTDHHARGVPAGEPIHAMWVCLVFDADMLVHDVLAGTDAAPYAGCFGAPETLSRMRGVRIASGWAREVQARLGGAQSCTHLKELLLPMATAAYQTASRIRQARPTPLDPQGRPLKIDSCWAYSSEGELVARRWPEHVVKPPEKR